MKNILKLIGVILIILAAIFIIDIPLLLFVRFLESNYSDITMIIIYASAILLLIGSFVCGIVFKDKK